jgi:glycosyltransferase involved in cell wall biosynthesis
MMTTAGAGKILYVGTLPPHNGGSAISCGQLITEIARAGYLIAAISPATAASLDGGDHFAARHPELRIVRYLLPYFYLEPGTEELKRVEECQVRTLFQESVAGFDPDLVIVGRESFAPYVPELATAQGLPVVQWVRGSATSHYSYWKNTEDGRTRVLGFRRARVILTAAEHLTENLRRFGFDTAKTIPNAIDLDRFSPGPGSPELRAELGIDRNCSMILVPGNLIPRKRPFDVLEGAAKALDEEGSLMFVVAGAGKMLAEVREACRRRGLAERFRFPGWVDYERMPDFYRSADLVIVASELEGLARAYIEAMACERVLLCSRIPASQELVRDGVNGLFFRVGDADEMAEKILMVVRDCQLRARLGKEARRSVQDRSIHVAVRRYLEEIKTVLQLRPVSKGQS